MEVKKHSKSVTTRFLKAMKQIIANEIGDVTNQNEFCEKIGEYAQNISKMEDGTRYPTVEMLCNICLHFKVSPAWLLLEQGQMFSSGPMLMDINILSRLDEIEKFIGKQKKQTRKKAS